MTVIHSVRVVLAGSVVSTRVVVVVLVVVEVVVVVVDVVVVVLDVVESSVAGSQSSKSHGGKV